MQVEILQAGLRPIIAISIVLLTQHLVLWVFTFINELIEIEVRKTVPRYQTLIFP